MQTAVIHVCFCQIDDLVNRLCADRYFSKRIRVLYCQGSKTIRRRDRIFVCARQVCSLFFTYCIVFHVFFLYARIRNNPWNYPCNVENKNMRRSELNANADIKHKFFQINRKNIGWNIRLNINLAKFLHVNISRETFYFYDFVFFVFVLFQR